MVHITDMCELYCSELSGTGYTCVSNQHNGMIFKRKYEILTAFFVLKHKTFDVM